MNPTFEDEFQSILDNFHDHDFEEILDKISEFADTEKTDENNVLKIKGEIL